MDVVISAATTCDAKALFDLSHEWNGDAAADEHQIEHALRKTDEIVILAFLENKAIGFICGQITSSICHKTPHGEISELFVSEPYRKQGAGRKLIEAMEHHFKDSGIRIVTINTAVSNIPAQHCYSKCGYFDKQRVEYRKFLS